MSVTLMAVAPSITWLLVSTRPSEVSTMPVPAEVAFSSPSVDTTSASAGSVLAAIWLADSTILAVAVVVSAEVEFVPPSTPASVAAATSATVPVTSGRRRRALTLTPALPSRRRKVLVTRTGRLLTGGARAQGRPAGPRIPVARGILAPARSTAGARTRGFPSPGGNASRRTAIAGACRPPPFGPCYADDCRRIAAVLRGQHPTPLPASGNPGVKPSPRNDRC